MTPEQAIPILEDMHHYAKDRDLADDSEALRLGIEALKLTLELRKTYHAPEFLIIPGETKE